MVYAHFVDEKTLPPGGCVTSSWESAVKPEKTWVTWSPAQTFPTQVFLSRGGTYLK